MLEKFQVQVADDQLALLDGLDAGWARYTAGLSEAGETLEPAGEGMLGQAVCCSWFLQSRSTASQ